MDEHFSGAAIGHASILLYARPSKTPLQARRGVEGDAFCSEAERVIRQQSPGVEYIKFVHAPQKVMHRNAVLHYLASSSTY